MFRDHERASRLSQPRYRREDQRCTLWVELGGWLVEDDQSWLHGEDRSQGDALALAAAQGANASTDQVLRACLRQRIVDPRRHRQGGDPDIFQTKCDLALHGVVDGLELRVLEHKPDGTGEAACRRSDHVKAFDFSVPGDATSVEVGHQAVKHAE